MLGKATRRRKRLQMLSDITSKDYEGLGTRNFYFHDRKNLKFQDIFQDIRTFLGILIQLFQYKIK